MKKLYTAALLALCNIAFLSCQKEINVIPSDTPSEAPLSFTVASPSTKTALNGLQVNWAAGDQIRVYGHNTSTGTYTDNTTYTISDGIGQASAVFTKDNASEMTGTYDEYYAIYPGNLTISGLPDKMVFPRLNTNPNHLRNQSPSAGQFDPSVGIMTAVYDGDKFLFRHGVAYIKLTIPDDNVTKVDINFTANCIADTPTYTTSTGALNAAGNSSKNVTSAEGTFTKGQSYYFAAIPRSGYNPTTTVITLTGGQTYTTTHFTKPLVIGEIYDLGTPAKSTTPIISSDDLEIGYSTTSGNIAYSVINPTSDGVISASVTSATPDNWISVSTESSTVSFSCSENSSNDNRVASIRLVYSYEGGAKSVNKDIVITQLCAAASELTAISAYKKWDVTNNFKPLAESKGTSALNETFIDDNLKYICGGKIQFNASYLRFGGTGSASDKCVQFIISGPGTLSVTAKSAKDTDNSRSVAASHNSTSLGAQTVSATENTAYSWVITDAQNGDTISVFSGNSGINVYSIEWTPAN